MSRVSESTSHYGRTHVRLANLRRERYSCGLRRVGTFARATKRSVSCKGDYRGHCILRITRKSE